MSDLFSTCLLVSENSAAPELSVTEINLHPGEALSSDPGKTILIAGGFSSVTPENGFPLSSTLQLNHDLSTLGSKELEQIAKAELTRASEIDYLSYTVDADNRVCVLADSVKLLDDFIDQYGGVLDIEPLLVKGNSPDYPAITELNLDATGAACRIDYQERSPINSKLCTYCGACGQACPEQCISERLVVDFGSCTFCKECEKVCGAKAIDVHSVLNKTMELPAVVLLGSVHVDLPDVTEGVYRKDQLPDLFSTLFPCRVDEVVTWDQSLCQYSGRIGGGCDLCVSSCTFDAIKQDKQGVAVDPLKCEECGACVAACPTGSLQNQRFNDKAFVDYLKAITIPKGGTVVIGEEDSLHRLWWLQKGKRFTDSFFLEYGSVGSISLFHCMFFLARGAGRVVLLENADQPNGSRVAARQIALANNILSKLYDIENAVGAVAPGGLAALMETPSPGGFGVNTDTNNFVNRRQQLLVSLKSLVAGSGRTPTIQPEGYIPFATVHCDTSRCTQCMACLNDCRIQSLQADSQALTLNHVPGMCVGCGLCIRVCPENALRISPQFTLGEPFFSVTELAKAEPMACKSCGKVFGTRKSFERVMEILSKRETVDTSHFEYCDTCRVVKLFEAE